MVRIAEGVWPEEVREKDFFTPAGQYKVDNEATPTMRNSLMYKMSYYRYPPTSFPLTKIQSNVPCGTSGRSCPRTNPPC